jgi:hypothetical protein
MRISKEAMESAGMWFDVHQDLPRWSSELEDLASRFQRYGDARVEAAERRIRQLEQELEKENQT